jgi:hypothetical protein
MAAVNTSDDSNSQTLQDDEAADASDEDNDDDDDDDEPEFFAPSHVHRRHGAGRFSVGDLVTAAHQQNSKLWDEDDDDYYEAVNDIPDDDDYDETQMLDKDDVLAQMAHDHDAFELSFPLDGMSDFGLGGDGQWPSTSDDSDYMPEMPPPRQVRFDEPPSPTRLLNGSVSPLLTRPLLPSAIPDIPYIESARSSHPHSPITAFNVPTTPRQQTSGVVEKDPYDCMFVHKAL